MRFDQEVQSTLRHLSESFNVFSCLNYTDRKWRSDWQKCILARQTTPHSSLSGRTRKWQY